MNRKRITRRRALAALGASGVTALAGCTGEDGNGGGNDTGTSTATGGGGGGGASGTVKIGVLQPLSGNLKYYGQQSLWGFFQGFNYKSDSEFSGKAETGTQTVTVGDVDYELLIRDTELKSSRAQELATTLVSSDDVDLLFGCTSSASASTVAKTVTKQSGVPTLFGPAASASITSESDTCGKNVFRASENTAMDARSGGKYVAENTDVSKVYLFGADYSFGRAVVNNYQTVLEANGVEIVGKKFTERGYSEWEGLLNNAEQAGAEGIVAGYTVQTLPALFTTFLNGNYSFRVFGGFATQITNKIIGQTLKEVLGEPLTKQKLSNAKLGPFTTRYHWNQYDNEINSAFVDAYTKAYGVVPDLFTSGTFTASSAIVQAVEASGSTTGADVAAELRGMTVADTPKGKNGYAFQSYNNQARSAMTIADVVPSDQKNWNAAVMPSKPVATIGKESTTIPKDSKDMGCSL